MRHNEFRLGVDAFLNLLDMEAISFSFVLRPCPVLRTEPRCISLLSVIRHVGWLNGGDVRIGACCPLMSPALTLSVALRTYQYAAVIRPVGQKKSLLKTPQCESFARVKVPETSEDNSTY